MHSCSIYCIKWWHKNSSQVSARLSIPHLLNDGYRNHIHIRLTPHTSFCWSTWETQGSLRNNQQATGNSVSSQSSPDIPALCPDSSPFNSQSHQHGLCLFPTSVLPTHLSSWPVSVPFLSPELSSCVWKFHVVPQCQVSWNSCSNISWGNVAFPGQAHSRQEKL